MSVTKDKYSKRPCWIPESQVSPISPAIMESIDPSSYLSFSNSEFGSEVNLNKEKDKKSILPDITLTSQFTSLHLGHADMNDNMVKSFLLIDGKENLKVKSADEFVYKLGCLDENIRVKVVSIFGNTGDGKSHTLNQVFFGGETVFHVSSKQQSCTEGVWASFDKTSSTICIDTEGLLGTTMEEARRTRLLLKVLALSDVVLYRTRSDRLHRDMFTFLGSASRAYSTHFTGSLDAVASRSQGGSISPTSPGLSRSVMGPAVIIAHETRDTEPLSPCGFESAEDILRSHFRYLGVEIDSFSSLKYLGQQTKEPPTDYAPLRKLVFTEINNTTVRSPRSPRVVFTALRTLNDKFNGALPTTAEIFPDEYFTCQSVCQACGSRCRLSMGHPPEKHLSKNKCKYTHQYENLVYLCKACYKHGMENVVKLTTHSASESTWYSLARYAWSGSVIDCPSCGEIYRSRQFWYGNVPPEASAVRSEIHHVWPGMVCSGVCAQNSSQRVVDCVNAISEVVVQVSATPTKALGAWVADQIINPKYWKLNQAIKECSVCSIMFTGDMTKHHCRSCGEGVCAECSPHTKPVPERGWTYPVRVCTRCYSPAKPPTAASTQDAQGKEGPPPPAILVANFPDQPPIYVSVPRTPNQQSSNSTSGDENEVIVRKVSEAVVTTISSVASILEYPKNVIKDTARPSYWTPDSEARECCVCSSAFISVGGKAELHHCRSCGGAVCPGCSRGRRTVPHRGWTSPVRICDNCNSSQ